MMSLSDRRVMQRSGSLLDGVLQDRISGEVGWQQRSYPLGGDGTHALVWVYSKDGSSESGSDRGWVDYLQWTPGGGGGGSSTTDWQQITYTYDPSGRRIAKDVDGVGHSSRGRSSRLRWTCST
ncbi:MAG: hypothetical protein RBS72_00855 [Sedimentisphaerales bacterium]|jgi:YD repeat-containing protein|nr:hypothetical protein [Sedimentisphaerales bacterium]NLZ07172.1 hypothetical protein [Phycisphaerae bacterium]HNY76843.1 hypothetical protein [Sedimentisphaerales bacterium]HOC62697.1 hypothetical protein [Sedimentisphaerales bacterium]HOH62617.1 hypothetical protein [Sedimentisphaerales bacterium]